MALSLKGQTTCDRKH